MNKKIVGLAIACLLSISLASAGAWAYFSDIETSTGNTLTAGTLDLVPDTYGTGPGGKYTVTPGGNGINGYVVFQKLAPGDSGSITWVLSNNGTLPGTLTLSSTVTFAENGVANEIETALPGSNNGGGNGDFDDYVGVRVKRNGTYFLPGNGPPYYYVPFSGLQNALNLEINQAMAASGGTITYVLEWSIAADVKGAGADGKFGTGDDVDVNDNIIQSDSAQINITFTLNQ